MRQSLRILAASCALCGAALAGPVADPARHPDAEDTYTVSATLQVLNPVDPAAMNDDFQDARVLARDPESCTVEVTYYPLFQPAVGENPRWREEDAGMTEYLRPMPTENWDEAMRRDLVGELQSAGIFPERLTDRQLVEKVSTWAMKRSHYKDVFSVWAVYFPDGSPAVFPPLREAFDRLKPDGSWTDQRMFDQEALGRSMFYARVHGACTSSSIYLATILRALGIPARIIICIPPFDPNDSAQAQMFYGAIHHNRARETVREALDGAGGFCDHMFNEVYVGRGWVRLNYSRLGQPILDAHYFGLLTHIYTCSDISQVPLAQTWGMRYFEYPAGQPRPSSSNPYRLVSVHDHFGANARLENPEVPVAELRTVTITRLLRPDSAELPGWEKENLVRTKRPPDFFMAFKEWAPGTYMQMRAFQRRASNDFVLAAPGHPDVAARIGGLKVSSGDGSFQAYGIEIPETERGKLAAGVAYAIRPVNTSDVYRWQVAPDLAPVVLKE